MLKSNRLYLRVVRRNILPLSCYDSEQAFENYTRNQENHLLILTGRLTRRSSIPTAANLRKSLSVSATAITIFPADFDGSDLRSKSQISDMSKIGNKICWRFAAIANYNLSSNLWRLLVIFACNQIRSESLLCRRLRNVRL